MIAFCQSVIIKDDDDEMMSPVQPGASSL